MKGTLLTGLMAVTLAGFGVQTASANLVLETFQQFSGTGLGTVPTIVTFQNNGSESGCVGLNGGIGSSVSATGACTGTGDTKTGSSQTQLQPLSAVGLTSATAANFALIFNAVQPSGNPLSVNSIVVSFYNPAGTSLLYQSTGLSCQTTSGGPIVSAGSGGCNLLTTATGTGNSGFLVTLDSTQLAAAIANNAFSSTSNLVGVSSSAGTGSFAAAGGSETIFLANVKNASTVPEPGTYVLLLSGLGLAAVSRIRRRA